MYDLDQNPSTVYVVLNLQDETNPDVYASWLKHAKHAWHAVNSTSP